MIRIYLIRHSRTHGNSLRRYIGVTDEQISKEGIALLEKYDYPRGEALYVSPLVRCRQTAALIFPNQKQIIVDKLSECNFGEFENKNAKELADNENYQKWIDSRATMPFPKGEDLAGFKKRCVDGFYEVVEDMKLSKIKSAALVIHGGTIMALMHHFASPSLDFYDWGVDNGQGYEFWVDEDNITRFIDWKPLFCNVKSERG